MDVFPVTWSAGDTAPGGLCRVTVFGKTPEGESACVHVRFTPYFFVEVPADAAASEAQARLFLTRLVMRYGAVDTKSRVVRRVPMWGYRAGRQQPFAQLVFESMEACKRARWGVGREHATYEAAVDPVVRLMHLRGLSPCKWLRVGAHRTPAHPLADVDREVECDFTAVGPSALTSRPPLVWASWDIEARSATGRFPVSDNPDDYLIQISTAFQTYGDAEPYHRAVTCLRDTAAVEGVEIRSYDSEADVINGWARLLRDHKVDVMLAYNSHQ